MDTFLRIKENVLYAHWRSWVTLALIQVSLLCVVAAIFLLLSFTPEVSPAQSITSDAHKPHSVTRQQVIERYKDPTLSYFLGKKGVAP